MFGKSIFCCPDKGKRSITVGFGVNSVERSVERCSPRLTRRTHSQPRKWAEHQIAVILDKFNHFVAGELLFSPPWAYTHGYSDLATPWHHNENISHSSFHFVSFGISLPCRYYYIILK